MGGGVNEPVFSSFCSKCRAIILFTLSQMLSKSIEKLSTTNQIASGQVPTLTRWLRTWP